MQKDLISLNKPVQVSSA